MNNLNIGYGLSFNPEILRNHFSHILNTEIGENISLSELALPIIVSLGVEYLVSPQGINTCTTYAKSAYQCFAHVTSFAKDRFRFYTSRNYTIECIRSIFSHEGKSVINASLQLITAEMDSFDIGRILDAVRDIPAAERESIVNTSRLLIKPEMETFHITNILETVGNIPAA